MRKLTRRSAAIVTGSILAVAGGTAAFAYNNGWFSGDSTVTAAASTIQTLHATVNLGSSRLWPGHRVQVTVPSLNNTNEYPVKITGISVSSVSSTPTGCGQSEAGLTFESTPATTLTPGGNSNVSLGLIKMSPDASSVCAGKVLTVSATLTGELDDTAAN